MNKSLRLGIAIGIGLMATIGLILGMIFTGGQANAGPGFVSGYGPAFVRLIDTGYVAQVLRQAHLLGQTAVCTESFNYPRTDTIRCVITEHH